MKVKWIDKDGVYRCIKVRAPSLEVSPKYLVAGAAWDWTRLGRIKILCITLHIPFVVVVFTVSYISLAPIEEGELLWWLRQRAEPEENEGGVQCLEDAQ